MLKFRSGYISLYPQPAVYNVSIPHVFTSICCYLVSRWQPFSQGRGGGGRCGGGAACGWGGNGIPVCFSWPFSGSRGCSGGPSVHVYSVSENYAQLIFPFFNQIIRGSTFKFLSSLYSLDIDLHWMDSWERFSPVPRGITSCNYFLHCEEVFQF